MESLIKAGATDSLGDRGTLLNNVGRILSLAQREQRLRETGQSTMFDLWGEATNVPMPSLDMVAADIPIKEKLAWERELMGVYLSEHPFSPYASKAASENATLCGQIDAEMEGQTVTVAGMAASVRGLLTRDGQPSASVMLEDLDGKLEVMVWPRVYAPTRELWQEGNVLLVEGKVRLRGDRVQLVCERVRRYQLEEVGDEAAVTSQSGEAPPAAAEAVVAPQPEAFRRLAISVSQTSDEAGDIAHLHKIINTLREFPGRDEVSLAVYNEKKVFRLRLSTIRVNYCPELHKRLLELVAEDEVRLETDA
jgi:DNA polymerase-3 subunit alpha